MRRQLTLLALSSALLIASCGAPSARTAEETASHTQSLEARLVDYAADDFRNHVAPEGVTFRNVQLGEMRGDNGASRKLICGEYRADDAIWHAFATIETDPYENWLGDSATGYCTRPGTTMETDRDLADALNQRYRGL